MTSQWCNNFQFIHLGKITRNYYTPVTCYRVISVIYLIRSQSERYIITIIMSMIMMINMLIILIMMDYKHDGNDNEYDNNHDNGGV